MRCGRGQAAVASAVSAEFWGARAPSRAGERASRSRTSLLKLLQKETKIAKKLQSWTCSFVSFVAFCQKFLERKRSIEHDGCAFDDDLADFDNNMNIETLHIGMKVRHPEYGVGVVKSLTGQTAEIAFDDAQRTIAPASSDLQPAEPTATLSELQMPLAKLIRDTAHAVVEALGLEQKDVLVEGLATRWQRGTLVMQPADSSLQPKEVPLETFFHKIVMIRNNLRVLEQKVNASDKLSDADKFDLQQYITRCYGSLTTFNILFKNKDDQFRTSA